MSLVGLKGTIHDGTGLKMNRGKGLFRRNKRKWRFHIPPGSHYQKQLRQLFDHAWVEQIDLEKILLLGAIPVERLAPDNDDAKYVLVVASIA